MSSTSPAGPVRTVYVDAQNGAGADLADQSAAALDSVRQVLAESGGALRDVVSWSVSVVGVDVDARPAVQAIDRVRAGTGTAPAVTVARVGSLAGPDSHVEISAVAVVAA